MKMEMNDFAANICGIGPKEAPEKIKRDDYLPDCPLNENIPEGTITSDQWLGVLR